MNLKNILDYAMESGCSDIHLTTGNNPYFRLNGKLKKTGDEFRTINDDDIYAYLTILSKGKDIKEVLEKNGSFDSSYENTEGKRFRYNIFMQRSKIAIAIRLVESVPPTLDDLKLPDVIKQILKNTKGLILVTGPTGSGKSTSLAAMVDYLNEINSYHIITLEDPIEFIHNNKQSLINQREIGQDSISYSEGLTSALRQDPDVILLGEMRSNESISTALKAAETGHLVLSTLHTNDAPSTVDRIVDSFPGDQQDQIRVQLAESLVAVISQRLIPTVDGKGRVAAFEIMINNHAIKNLIRKSKTFQIKNTIDMNRSSGMTTMERSLDELKIKGLISSDDDNKI